MSQLFAFKNLKNHVKLHIYIYYTIHNNGWWSLSPTLSVVGRLFRTAGPSVRLIWPKSCCMHFKWQQPGASIDPFPIWAQPIPQSCVHLPLPFLPIILSLSLLACPPRSSFLDPSRFPIPFLSSPSLLSHPSFPSYPVPRNIRNHSLSSEGSESDHINYWNVNIFFLNA